MSPVNAGESDKRLSKTGWTLSQCLGRPFQPDNAIRVLNNGDEIFPAILAAIDHAQASIEFQTYLYWGGDIAHKFALKLAQAAERGVRVRVLLDSFGCMTMDKSTLAILEQRCEVCWFRPLSKIRLWKNTKRSHRKLLICDGRVGFTGGLGIGDPWLGNGRTAGQWRDDHFQIEGPVVNALRAAFLENWLEACEGADDLIAELRDDHTQPAGEERVMPISSTASDFWSAAATVIRTATTVSTSSLRICTPYLVTDRVLEHSLIAAKKRGVDITITVPDPPNSDSKLAALAAINCLPRLLQHGITVFAYEPTLIHRKCLVINDEVAIIGSVNFNQRSQRKDDEFCLLIDKGATVEKLIGDFEQDRNYARQLDPSEFQRRHFFLGKAARLIDPFRQHI